MKTTLAMTAALAALVMSAGCGDDGSGSSGGPSGAQAASAQKAEEATGAATQSMNISTQALADSGSGGAVSAKGVPSAGKTTVNSFNYQADVNVTLDLDSVDGLGNDRWPNASGQLNIVAHGSLSGDSTSGTALYDVTTVWLTPGVFTDPCSGAVATMAVGSGLQYSASLTWTWTAQDNWSVSASSDLSGQHELSVTDDGVTVTATASGSRHAEVMFSQSPSGFSLTWNVTGTWTVTLTNGAETHVITVTMLNPNHITITVDGEVFGPYTAHQIRVYFNCIIE